MRDQIVVADETERGLVCVVEALAAHLAVQGGDAFHGLASSLRPALAAGEGPLRCLQLFRGVAAVARVVDVPAVGGGQKRGDPQIDTDHGSGRGERFGRCLVGREDHVPAAPFTA